MRRISSRQNPLVTRFRTVARARPADGLVLLDGAHLVDEALTSGVPLETVAFADRLADADPDGLVQRVIAAGAEAVAVPEVVLAAMSPVRQPSGVVALARVHAASLDATLATAPQLVLVLAGVQDAGNVGAIIRAADGCGATGIIAAEGTADPFGWKALRGAMGSAFRLPVAARQTLAATLDAIRARRIALVATVPRHGRALPACDLARPSAIVLGAEGAGLSDAIVAAADERMTIPMRPPVESLNVAITAALILYEASHQRTTPHDVVIR